jgi:hypothetical protein
MAKLPSALKVVQSYLAERPRSAELHSVSAGGELRGRRFAEAGYAITGVLGGRPLQIFSQPKRVIEDFANTPRTPQDILRFTQRYGVVHREDVELWSADITLRKYIALRFIIDCTQWLKSQAQFCAEWERTGKPDDELARVLAEQINPKSAIERAVKAFVVPSKQGFQIELRPDDLLGSLWLAFVGFSGRTRKCQNPTCSAPYFIATRRDQKYCNEACSRLVANRKWWADKGAEWRESKLKKKGRNVE